MVVGRLGTEEADRVFHALSDATRRDILTRAGERGMSVMALAALYPMSFAAVQKHVAVLERADLVVKERRGRERIVRSNPDPVRRAAALLAEWERVWVGRAERMARMLDEEENER